MLAEVFGQGEKVDEPGLKSASYPAIKAFIVDVFSALDLSTKDFE